MTPRQQRALELVASGVTDELVSVGPEHWLVPSRANEGSFYVTSISDCTCPDSKYSGAAICKHSVAIRLQRVLDACKETSSA